MQEYNYLSSNQRRISDKNASFLISTYEIFHPTVKKDLREITNLEVSPDKKDADQVTGQAVLNHQGTLILNNTIVLNGKSASFLTYSYHPNYTTYIYSPLVQNGNTTTLDPLVMENSFPIYGWWHVDYGTFYNVNVKFATCNAAWNYYIFVSN